MNALTSSLTSGLKDTVKTAIKNEINNKIDIIKPQLIEIFNKIKEQEINDENIKTFVSDIIDTVFNQIKIGGKTGKNKSFKRKTYKRRK